jgi:hypothetical protein
MSQNKKRWGILNLLAAFAIAGSSLYILKTYPPFNHTFFYTDFLPVSGLFFSILLVLIGHFSYSRIHNLKVYFSGYMAGFSGINYFLSIKSPLTNFIHISSTTYLTVLIITNFLNFLVLPLIPSYVKYKLARSTVLAFLIVESVVLITMRSTAAATEWVSYLNFEHISDMGFWIGTVVFIIGTLLTIWLVKDDFYLGGTISGFLFICAMSWSFGTGGEQDETAGKF